MAQLCLLELGLGPMTLGDVAVARHDRPDRGVVESVDGHDVEQPVHAVPAPAPYLGRDGFGAVREQTPEQLLRP